LNKWNQFKRLIFSDPGKNIWLKRIYFFLISLNLKCEVFGTGADAFVLKEYLKENDLLGITYQSHVLFLAGDLNLNEDKIKKGLEEKINQLRYPRFVFIFGATAGREASQSCSKKIKGDFFIPGGNYICENLYTLKKNILTALALHPEKNQEKYNETE
jgi:hypothetical protein